MIDELSAFTAESLIGREQDQNNAVGNAFESANVGGCHYINLPLAIKEFSQRTDKRNVLNDKIDENKISDTMDFYFPIGNQSVLGILNKMQNWAP
jgi:hypothetical protein